MIGRLNHVAIATSDMQEGGEGLSRHAGRERSPDAVPQPDHGVTTVFVDLPNTKIELLEPLGDELADREFPEENPNGGMHHVCYEVDDIYTRARPDACRRRDHHRHGRAAHRRARQAGVVPASEGFRRHPGRARTSVMGGSPVARAPCRQCFRDYLVLGAVLSTAGGLGAAARIHEYRRAAACRSFAAR